MSHLHPDINNVHKKDVIYDIVNPLKYANNLGDLIDIIIDSLNHQFNCKFITFSIFVDGKIDTLYYWGYSPTEIYYTPTPIGLMTYCALSGESQICNHVDLNSSFVINNSNEKFSEIDIPIQYQNKTIAVLSIVKSGSDFFSNLDIRLLEIFSQYIIMSLEKISSAWMAHSHLI